MAIDVNILALVKSKLFYRKVENAFAKEKTVSIIECTNLGECLNKIKETSLQLSCVVMDVDYGEAEAIEDLKNIREAIGNDVPIVVMSFSKNISFYSDAINQGANDLIIKPFTDEFLHERIFKLIGKNKKRNVEIVSLSLYKYLNGELRKAEKGKYPLTLMLTTISFSDEEKYTSAQKIFYLDSYFNMIKGMYWDTDLFIKFDVKYYLGVFPFCNTENVKVIEKKNNESFEELVRANIMPNDCKIITSFVSYPENMKTIVQGFSMLMKKSKSDFSDSDLEIYFKEYGDITYS